MIDFVKIQIYGLTVEDYFNNPLLDFQYQVSSKTGEVKPNHEADHRDLKAKINGDKYLYIQGSLHKYKLGNNTGDFNYQALIETIIDLNQKFQINPSTSVLRNLEFGVNIDPQIPTRKVLESILNYKGKRPTIRTFQGRGYMVQFAFNQYYLKIYDKGFQNKLPENILRIEIKVIKMEYLKKYGIHFLNDILDPAILTILGLKLASTFNDVLIYDNSIKSLELSASEHLNLKDYSNPRYWEGLKKQSPKNFQYHKVMFREISYRISDNFQKNIHKLILQKWEDLMFIPPDIVEKITQFLKGFTSKIDPSIISTILPVTPRCKITGKDISDQKPGSQFLSEGKVGYKEAHRLRNQDSNPRNSLRYKLERIKKHPTLFALDKMIVLSEEQIESLKFWNGSKYEVDI